MIQFGEAEANKGSDNNGEIIYSRELIILGNCGPLISFHDQLSCHELTPERVVHGT